LDEECQKFFFIQKMTPKKHIAKHYLSEVKRFPIVPRALGERRRSQVST
jgi:hypothetical protein